MWLEVCDGGRAWCVVSVWWEVVGGRVRTWWFVGVWWEVGSVKWVMRGVWWWLGGWRVMGGV